MSYIDNDLKKLVIDDGESETTAAFQRVIQRAVIHVLSSGREEVTGGTSWSRSSPSARAPPPISCRSREMTRDDAVNCISDGIKKGDGDTAVQLLSQN